MQADHWRTDAEQPVQVCSVQTLARRRIPPASVVFIDEAHRMFDSVNDWMADPQWADTPFVGLSATPWTRGLGKHYDDLIIAATTQELIDGKLLVPPVVFAPSTPDTDGVRINAGEFNQHDLAEVCDTSKLVGDIIETWRQRADGVATLCYGVNRAHAEHVQQRFIEAGVPAEYMDCFTDGATRERIFARFRAGQTRVICNVGVLTTGVDFDVRCIIDAHPTRSEILFVQTIGRGLRTAEGKDKLVVLDHAGNHLRLGMVGDIHHAYLDDGRQRRAGERRERPAPLPKLCQNCACVLPARALRCEQCGTPVETRCAVEASDEQLVPLGTVAAARTPDHAEQLDYMAELKWIAEERGYSPGWCAHKFREKFNCWPNDSSIRCYDPQPAGLKVRQWVRSRAIAYARSQEKARRHG
jgi:superfamily II DNA or RNA helicase